MYSTRKGFTLLEVVLSMILITILSISLTIGFSSYLEKANRAGIITDFNSTFLNPVRISVITTGKFPQLSAVRKIVLSDGFLSYTGEKWVEPIVEIENQVLGFEKGIKRYEISLMTDEFGEEFIRVRSDHSKTGLYVDYYLDEMHQDVLIKYSNDY